MSLNWLLDAIEERMIEVGFKVYCLDDKKKEFDL